MLLEGVREAHLQDFSEIESPQNEFQVLDLKMMFTPKSGRFPPSENSSLGHLSSSFTSRAELTGVGK